MQIFREPYIPEYLTVHLGSPSSYADNVTVSFPDYIKNVASSEIYPTWKESALYANIYAQISFTINRVYTEYYKAQGYNFEITNDTNFDQRFIYGRNIFENISNIVDQIFNSYIRVVGTVIPLPAKYCNGTTVTCNGLSQWGSQRLAEEGASCIEILKFYYGDNIEIINNVQIKGITESYPGYPLTIGSSGDDVKFIQVSLNRISEDYPLIPKLYPVDGIFGKNTYNAVIKMQEIFNLEADGIVGRATWYKLVYLYNGLINISELYTEGEQLLYVPLESPESLKIGDQGDKVNVLQYMINVISEFDSQIPSTTSDGIYGEKTENSIKAIQEKYKLPVTGVVDEATWDLMYRIVKNTYDTVFFDSNGFDIKIVPYPGYVLQIGSAGEEVRILQEYINEIANNFENIEPVSITGIYGRSTRRAVMDLQGIYGIIRTGNVNEPTWNAITNAYRNSIISRTTQENQYPGYELSNGGESSD